MRKRNTLVGVTLVLALIVSLVAATVGSARPSAAKASFSAALVSDIIGFNDAGFNKNQLKGLNAAVKKVGGTAIPEVSHSSSDYAPNFNNAIRKGANIVVAAGFLLANTEAIYAKKFPKIDFAITDYTVHAAPFADKKGNVLPAFKNVEGITYAANESGCLVGVLAAKMAKKLGGHTIGAVGGLKIPPVVNKGASGHKAENLIVRFQKDVVDLKPAVVTISIGINDVWHRLKNPHDEPDVHIRCQSVY